MSKNRGKDRQARKESKQRHQRLLSHQRKFPNYGDGLNRIRIFAANDGPSAIYGYVNINGIEYTFTGDSKGLSTTTGKTWWGGILNLKH
jgi:hypothetical protein